MRTTPSGIPLSFALALLAVLPASAQAADYAPLKVKAQSAAPAQRPAGARAMFAPGQPDYTCNFTKGDANECKPVTVQIWLIPTIDGGTAGCVAAFPYKSIVLPSTLPNTVKAFTLTWNLPTPPTSVEYEFVGDGIEVQPLDEDIFGARAKLLTGQPVVTKTQVNWTVNFDASTAGRFIGNHQPNVRYRVTGGYSKWHNCVPVDPVITNNS